VSTELKGQVGAKGGRFTDSKQDFGTPNLGFLKNVSNLPDNLKIVNIEPFTTSASQQVMTLLKQQVLVTPQKSALLALQTIP
jgi:hypothetical protein